VNMYLLNKPEVMVPFAQNKVDASGNLTDEETRKRIKALLEALVLWTRRLRGK
jgi:chromate reductase, NAD(P)H dehydrogenase (quinone)